jgi:hypothetical protein
MKRDEWKQLHGFSDEWMRFFDYVISQGCKIVNIENIENKTCKFR